MTKTSSIEKMSFEEALKELETSVRQLEEGSLPLEESIKVFEKGALLSKHCEHKLKEANAKVEKITLNQYQEPTDTEPLDPLS